MYTTDEAYQPEQRERAGQTIARIAERYHSRVHCLAELEWWRSVYQAYGNWQAAIDLLEEQMIAWGRKEQGENRELIVRFDLLFKQNSVASTKGEWDEEDYAVLGKARAYSEARYALQFLPLMEAMVLLNKPAKRSSKILRTPPVMNQIRLKEEGQQSNSEMSLINSRGQQNMDQDEQEFAALNAALNADLTASDAEYSRKSSEPSISILSKFEVPVKSKNRSTISSIGKRSMDSYKHAWHEIMPLSRPTCGARMHQKSGLRRVRVLSSLHFGVSVLRVSQKKLRLI